MNKQSNTSYGLKRIRLYTTFLFVLPAGLLSASTTNSSTAVSVQQQSVSSLSGIINDSKGVPLIGVSVVEKGTTNGTITDVDGKFSLKHTKKNAVLIITYVGFKTQEVSTGSNKSLSISMEETATDLNEVIVVGYGTQKKATLTGSVSQISGDDLKKVAATNLTNTLAGKTAGVIANVRTGEPGEDNAQILIRGKGTTGDTSPLIVVDGIADRGFARLNPEDIESISVLKDASAAIYGARAANGVILVTTKRGKEGKVKVNYSGNISFSQPTRIPKMLDAYQYGTYVNEYDRGHGLTETYSQDALQKMQDGSDPINYPSTNWWKSVAKDWATRTQHSLSVSGGTDKISFYSSIQYLWQDAIYKNSAQNYGQYQFTSNLDAKVSSKIRFSFDIEGRQESRKRGVYATDYLFGYLLTTNPMSAPYYPNGLPRTGYDGITNNAAVMVTNAPGTNDYKNNIINLKPTLHVDLDCITPGLYAETYAALDFSFDNGKQLNHPYDLYVYDESTNEYTSRRSATGAISLSSWADNSDRITLNSRIGYKTTINKAHKIEAFAAYEQSQYNYNNVSASRTNYLSTAIPEIFAGSDNPDDWGTGGYGSKSSRQNYFGRINYSYKDKYLAEVTMRYDGSMNFAPGKRWGFFPAFSLGWVMSDESFFQALKPAVSFFKLKGSWGQMGNDNISPFQYLSRYSFISDPGGVMFGESVVKGLYEVVKANPNITWETAKTGNIGFSAQFLDGKINLDFDYFNSHRSNILLTRNASIPSYTGLVLPVENIGKVNNHGVEIVMGYNGSYKDFTWGVTGNFTYAQNKIVYIDEAKTTPAWQRATGFPIDGLTLYQAKGIYQTQDQIDKTPHISGAKPGDLIYEDKNGDGKITWDDAIRVNDSATPKVMYGLTLNGKWKGIDMNIFFQGQAAAKILVQPTMNMMTDFYEGRWIDTNTPEQNANARWPRAFIKQTYGDTWNGSASTWWLRDASFLRLKSVEIGYSLPKSLTKKLGLENLRIYVNGNNLFTLDKIKAFDPEISVNSTNYQANGLTAYPIQRSLTTGLNVTF